MKTTTRRCKDGKKIDNVIEEFIKLSNEQLQLAEQQQLRFYNIFAKVFNKDVFQMWI